MIGPCLIFLIGGGKLSAKFKNGKAYGKGIYSTKDNKRIRITYVNNKIMTKDSLNK